MNLQRLSRTAVAGLLVAGLAVPLLAPDADAKGKHRRYKYKERVVQYRHHPAPYRVIEVHRHSHGVPVLAGFIGGLALGAVLSRPAEAAYHHYPAAACRPADHYYYYDPYCGDRFASLDVYVVHLRHHHHPGIVRVIELETGDWVHTYRYHRGSWRDWDEDYDD